MGKANFGGIVKQVGLEYTREIVLGDYVLVHAGFALSKVDEEEAAPTYKALRSFSSWASSMSRMGMIRMRIHFPNRRLSECAYDRPPNER